MRHPVVGDGPRRRRSHGHQGARRPGRRLHDARHRVAARLGPAGAALPGTAADGASARVVFVAPNGEKVTAADNRAAIEKLVTEAADGSQVASAVDPFTARAVSEDATTAYSTVTFEVTADDLTGAAGTQLERAATPPGTRV